MSGIVLEHRGFMMVESYEKVDVAHDFRREESRNEIILEPSFYKKFELKPAFQIARIREIPLQKKQGFKEGMRW